MLKSSLWVLCAEHADCAGARMEAGKREAVAAVLVGDAGGWTGMVRAELVWVLRL